MKMQKRSASGNLVNDAAIILRKTEYEGVSVLVFYLNLSKLDLVIKRRLFNIINDLPTVFEVVTNIAKKQVKEKSSSANGSKSKSSFKFIGYIFYLSRIFRVKLKCKKCAQGSRRQGKRYEEDEDEHGDTLCRACGENCASNEFWICCDIYEKWFHGKFVV
ncbi:PHD finger protein ALFIN-LIKE 5-like [Cucumis melo]|uniref:PHD finger protein ALFIN-LIKE n=1 Tax=Cucumis melo TaxID=3656 RepID=A0ABM3KIV9_CUCME|nr:PHD finger protein ALFIN-LIKE 5-like [Cucumis melo]